MLESSARRAHVGRVARVAGVALVTALALAGARLAAAQTQPAAAALRWEAPAGCPTEAQVMADVEQNLAGAAAGPALFTAVVGVRGPVDGRWEASLQFEARDARATRAFEAESCEAIASAAALVIALWAEGWADAPAPPPVPASPAPPSEIGSAPVIAVNAARGVAPKGDRFVLAVNALLDAKTMPGAPAAGVEASGGPVWTGPWWRFRALGGLSYFPRHRTTPDTTPQADLWLLDVSARGCLTFGGDRFEIGPCAGAELAIMDGSVVPGQGMQSYSADFLESPQTWLSLSASAVISWRVLPWVAVFARGDLVKPTIQRNFNVLGENVFVWRVYEVPAHAWRGAMGIEVRF
jgi:hypothetical protein